VGRAIGSFNTQYQAKIRAIRIGIDTTAGEPVLWVLTDLQLERGTSWWGDGVTNMLGPSPTTTV
jgi:hypothetical protein